MQAKGNLLFITPYKLNDSYISNNSKNLIEAYNTCFSSNFSIQVCALYTEDEDTIGIDEDIKFKINTRNRNDLINLAEKINSDITIKAVYINHHFNLFEGSYGENFLYLLFSITKPVIIHFNEVIKTPDHKRLQLVRSMVNAAEFVTVASQYHKDILLKHYQIKPHQINILNPGVSFYKTNFKSLIENKHQPEDGLMLTSITPIGPEYNIETGLQTIALLKNLYPDITYVIIRQEDTMLIKSEVEKYKQYLKNKIINLKLEDNVKFIDYDLSYKEIETYIKTSDFLLITSQKENTDILHFLSLAFNYGCVVVSSNKTLNEKLLIDRETGVVFDQNDFKVISDQIQYFIEENESRNAIQINAYKSVSKFAWENLAASFTQMINTIITNNSEIIYNQIPIVYDNTLAINSNDYLKNDIKSLASLLTSSCYTYEYIKEFNSIRLIETYFDVIENFIHINAKIQGETEKLNEDEVASIICSLGRVISLKNISDELVTRARICFHILINKIELLSSAKSIALTIKGLYLYLIRKENSEIKELINRLSEQLIEKYFKASKYEKEWENQFISNSNCLLSEALLYNYLVNGKEWHKVTAKLCFDLLLSESFAKGYFQINDKNNSSTYQVETSEDVACFLQTLEQFYIVFKDNSYKNKIIDTYNWFLGHNKASLRVFNKITNKCYDGIQDSWLILGQSTEAQSGYIISSVIAECTKSNEIPEKSMINTTENQELNMIEKYPFWINTVLKSNPPVNA